MKWITFRKDLENRKLETDTSFIRHTMGRRALSTSFALAKSPPVLWLCHNTEPTRYRSPWVWVSLQGRTEPHNQDRRDLGGHHTIVGTLSRWFCGVVMTIDSEGPSQAQTISMTTCRPSPVGDGSNQFLISKFLNPYGKSSNLTLDFPDDSDDKVFARARTGPASSTRCKLPPTGHGDRKPPHSRGRVTETGENDEVIA
jgi:hypothetical protein